MFQKSPIIFLIVLLFFLCLSCSKTEQDLKGKQTGSPGSGGTEVKHVETTEGGKPQTLEIKKSFVNKVLFYNGPGRKLTVDDTELVAKYDMIMWSRGRYEQIPFENIKKLNPDIQIYCYQQGVDIWRSWDSEGKWLLEDETIRDINNVARFSISRGHSMGNLDKDNPDLFLKKKDGTRVLSYKDPKRFVMDFGTEKWVQYWIEATTHDIIDQKWRPDGVFMDNTAPILSWPLEDPAKYNTPETWAKATNWYVNRITEELHKKNIKTWINAGGTADKDKWQALIDLDNSEFPPDAVAEEGAFVHGWGSERFKVRFYKEEEWKNQVDFLSVIRNSIQTYLSHCRLEPGEESPSNDSRTATFEQCLWYGLTSFLLGKDDDLDNAYFMFGGKKADKGYTTYLWYFDEYDHIDLGAAKGKYKVSTDAGTNIYWREFEKGYVYVNPTLKDGAGIKLPEECRQIGHENFKDNLASIKSVKSIDLPVHRGTIVVKRDVDSIKPVK